jgi:hypothetical protein
MFAMANCFKEAGERYQINPLLLQALVMRENASFDKEPVNCANSNGSCDFGFAQINLSEWGDELVEFGITLNDLRDPCQNLTFFAWILARNFQTHGVNWRSVGALNAGFSDKKNKVRQRYIDAVKRNLDVLLAQQNTQ